jgi:hypothetical protein
LDDREHECRRFWPQGHEKKETIMLRFLKFGIAGLALSSGVIATGCASTPSAPSAAATPGPAVA